MFDTDGRPLHVNWRYDRAELLADAVVHIIGIAFGAVGAVAIVALAMVHASPAVQAAVTVYAFGLVGVLGVSAAYNMWPVSPTKWWLRRFDHALIFVLIAGTYTPFVSRFGTNTEAIVLLIGIWMVAAAGAAIKILLPGRFDRAVIAIYLLLGFSGFLLWDTVVAALPTSTLVLVVIGGLTYTAGVIFHVWDGLRFQNAVWHAFVLIASIVFYSAVLGGVVLG